MPFSLNPSLIRPQIRAQNDEVCVRSGPQMAEFIEPERTGGNAGDGGDRLVD